MSRFRLVCLAAVFSEACSGGAPPPSRVVLPSFRDVSEAPAVIQTAAEAVLRLDTAQASGTASFISATGRLLTNNHLLGVDVCPIEGCYARITRMYQRHASAQPTETVYVVPVAIDAGMDMAVVQAYAGGPGGAPIDSPRFLALSARGDPASLQGTHVHVVGHPEGGLKKWSPGEIVDSSGEWIWTTAFTLPGNSGSPILDESGEIVGLVHRGRTAPDGITASGVNEYSIGTAAASLAKGMTAPLPASMRSTSASTTDADVVAHQFLYFNARASTAIVRGVSKPVLDSLAQACDAGLALPTYASPEDLAAALQPCADALLWSECRSDVTVDFGVCPKTPADWAARYASVNSRWLAFDGSIDYPMVTYGPAALAESSSVGNAAAVGLLEAALGTTHPPLDFALARRLAALDIPSYAGTPVLDFLNAYKAMPDYALSGTDIVQTAASLNRWGQLASLDFLALLDALAADDTLDLGTELLVEQMRYQLGVLD